MTDFLNWNENGKFSVNEKYKLIEQEVHAAVVVQAKMQKNYYKVCISKSQLPCRKQMVQFKSETTQHFINNDSLHSAAPQHLGHKSVNIQWPI